MSIVPDSWPFAPEPQRSLRLSELPLPVMPAQKAIPAGSTSALRRRTLERHFRWRERRQTRESHLRWQTPSGCTTRVIRQGFM